MPAHHEIVKFFSFSKRRIHKVRACHRDLTNILHYGPAAPRYSEQLWIKPENCFRFIPSSVLQDAGLLKRGESPRENTGCVSPEPWPVSHAINIYTALSDKFNVIDYPADLSLGYISMFKFRACHDHWVKGIPWQDTGIYDFLLYLISYWGEPVDGGCQTKADLIARYDKLDAVFETIERDGRFKTKQELGANAFRGRGCIYVHIGPQGEVFWGQGAQHRFSIAHILNLPFPAMLGMTHITGIPALKMLRREAQLLRGVEEIPAKSR